MPAAAAAPNPLARLLRVAGDGSARLLGGYSPTSGRHHFPRSELCPYTGATDVEDATLPSTGRLWLWTAVTARPPGYGGPVPYGFGVVELDGIGLRIVTRLTEADPSALREGQPMRLTTESLPGADGGTDDADSGADDADHGADDAELVVWAFEPDRG